MRTRVDWRTSSKDAYKDFCLKHPDIDISFDKWKRIIYLFNESFRDYILETGESIKFPSGFGEFSIAKKKPEKIKEHNGKKYINLPVDWKKTREKGKMVYNFNYHTEGYRFSWYWFKKRSSLSLSALWYFKASRITSRLLSHYLKVDEKYQHLYREWR
jgi:nucleoid DNA-binding protein